VESAVPDVLSIGGLSALRQQELPEDLDESELPLPKKQARHIAAPLESCAGALQSASGEVGD